MDKRKIEGISPTSVRLFISPEANRIERPTLSLELDIFLNTFPERPSSQFLLYNKVREKYEMSIWQPDMTSAIIFDSTRKPLPKDISGAVEEFFLEQRKRSNSIDIVTYAKACTVITKACDKILTLAPHLGYEPKGNPAPNYEIRKIRRK